MFDNLELENCPDKFALNCKRYDIKCHECLANNKGKHLLYLPINKSIKDHPAKNKPKKSKTNYSRKGKAQEQKTIDNSDLLKRTIGSGSYVGDGDAYISLGSLNKVRVEHKTRFNNKNLFNPTSNELKEGFTQDIKVWYIVDGVKKHRPPRIFCKYNLIMKLISRLFTSEKTRPRNLIDKDCYQIYIHQSKLPPIDLEFKYTTIKRGFGLSKVAQSYINFYRFVIAKTPYGKYCYLDFYLFEKLVKYYIELEDE